MIEKEKKEEVEKRVRGSYEEVERDEKRLTQEGKMKRKRQKK